MKGSATPQTTSDLPGDDDILDPRAKCPHSLDLVAGDISGHLRRKISRERRTYTPNEPNNEEKKKCPPKCGGPQKIQVVNLRPFGIF